MDIKITEKEKQLVLYGLKVAGDRLREYAGAYAKQRDELNAKDCMMEARKYYDLADKIARAK